MPQATRVKKRPREIKVVFADQPHPCECLGYGHPGPSFGPVRAHASWGLMQVNWPKLNPCEPLHS